MRDPASASLPLPAAFIEEGLGSRWGRRALTLTLYLALFVAVWAVLPLLVIVAAVSDAIRRKPLVAVRCVAMLAAYLACEAVGIVASGVLWFLRHTIGLERERYITLHYDLQRRWAGALFAAARAIFALRLEIEGEDQIGDEPLLVFIRHASIADTLLPTNLLTPNHGYRLFYVLKRELLWDACLDLVGNRLPNVFVRRGSGDSAKEIDAIRRLGVGLQPRQGVLIYPEGTRFTPAKRARALERLAQGKNPERAERAQQMQHLLPPHLGGPLALLEVAARADVLFIAHTGLEAAATLSEIWSGALVNRRIRVGLRRVARTDIPASREQRIAWLDTEWARVDAWIAANRS